MGKLVFYADMCIIKAIFCVVLLKVWFEPVPDRFKMDLEQLDLVTVRSIYLMS